MYKILKKLVFTSLPVHTKIQTQIKFTKVHMKKPETQNKPSNSMSPIALVWNQINQGSANNFSNLNKISTLILSLSAKEKQNSVKYLMANLYKSEIDGTRLFSNQNLEDILKEYPFIQVERASFLIGANEKKMESASEQEKNKLLNKINDLYLLCFNQYLPNAKDMEKQRIESLLYKNFGKHMIKIDAKETGIKGLKKSVESHRKLIVSQFHGLEEFNKMRESAMNKANKDKTQAQKDREVMQANAMKENIRRLIESMFETIFLYYQALQPQIQFKNLDKQTEQKVLDIISQISQCMKLKSIVPGSRQYSRYYHRLMKIVLQLEYAYCLKKNPSRVDLMLRLMKQFYKESIGDLQAMVDYIQIQKEIAIAMMTVRMHLSRSQKKNLKDELVMCSQQILQYGKFQKSPYKASIMKLLGDFIKKNSI